MIRSIFDRTQQYHVFDDFLANTSASAWQVVKGTGGTIAVETGGGSFLDLPTAASANDYVLLATPAPIVLPAQRKHVEVEFGFKFAEANTNNCILAFGLTSVLTTGFMQNGTGGPPASFNGAVFYKVSGGLNLGFRTSAASASTDNAAFAPLVSGSSYRLNLDVDLSDPTYALVTPRINGRTSLTQQVRPEAVQQKVNYTGWGALYPFVAVRAGSSSAETLAVDYISALGIR